MRLSAFLAMFLAVTGLSSCAANANPATPSVDAKPLTTPKPMMNDSLQVVTLGAGCFWCVEAIFQDLKGVTKVVSGYSGGQVDNPTYKQVCGGNTGHAEVVQVSYDPRVVSLDEILEVFWQTHDPTTLNRQGADVGTQYRSAIFYHTEEQRQIAEHYKKKLDASGAFKGAIVTEISAFTNFYPAEDYHQQYFTENPDQGYCQMVIRPKVEKFHKVFADKLKPGIK
jgi:peptide-methionine (S)-S-oxide reductase